MGLMIGILTVFIMISFALLIFSGNLSGYINQGIGFALFGGAVFSFIIALTSSFKGAIAVPQDTIVLVLAIMTSSLSTSMMNTASLETIAATVVALIVTTPFSCTGIMLRIGMSAGRPF